MEFLFINIFQDIKYRQQCDYETHVYKLHCKLNYSLNLLPCFSSGLLFAGDDLVVANFTFDTYKTKCYKTELFW